MAKEEAETNFARLLLLGYRSSPRSHPEHSLYTQKYGVIFYPQDSRVKYVIPALAASKLLVPYAMDVPTFACYLYTDTISYIPEIIT